VDPKTDGTRLAGIWPAIYPVAGIAPNSIPSAEFDRMLESTVPHEVMARIDDVLARSVALAERGLADSPPIHRYEWRRGIMLSWIHSRDLEVILTALGHPRRTLGIHDIEEYVFARHIKEHLEGADSWYRNWALSLADEEQINVGFFNPHLCASMYKWGDAKDGTQNAMDAHRLSPHHQGTEERPVDWIERSANFVIHHIPREHLGMRHEPRGDWSHIEERLLGDKGMHHAEVGKQIARDAAALVARLEHEGKVVPWYQLDIGEASMPTVSQVEHALHVVSYHKVRSAGRNEADPGVIDLRSLRNARRILEQFDAVMNHLSRQERHEEIARIRDLQQARLNAESHS
jgi:hypothetical protein